MCAACAEGGSPLSTADEPTEIVAEKRAAEQRWRKPQPAWLEGLRLLLVPYVDPYVDTLARFAFDSIETAFSLAALRVLALYRLEAQREGACPDVDIFESYEFDEAMNDPSGGGRIRVEGIAPGKFVLKPSRNIGFGHGDTSIFIDCPFDGFAASADPRP